MHNKSCVTDSTHMNHKDKTIASASDLYSRTFSMHSLCILYAKVVWAGIRGQRNSRGLLVCTVLAGCAFRGTGRYWHCLRRDHPWSLEWLTLPLRIASTGSKIISENLTQQEQSWLWCSELLRWLPGCNTQGNTEQYPNLLLSMLWTLSSGTRGNGQSEVKWIEVSGARADSSDKT